ncbi:MAG: YceI family protein [Bacteroidetes bacterium]|nr:YceI family protein [Bacteroidota bacterium]
MHTETYPYAAFTGRIVRTKPSDEGTKVDVRGTMDIHGVKHPMQVSGTISGSGDKIRVRSLFKVKLTDHDIEIPSFMFLKIDEVMELVLDYHLRNVNKQE